MDKFYKIAKQVHEVERTYLLSIGKTVPSWEDAPKDKQEARAKLVFLIMEGCVPSPEKAHAAWRVAKMLEGWSFGEKEDIQAKTHPYLTSYDNLPKEHRMKDYILFNIINVSKDIVLDDPIL